MKVKESTKSEVKISCEELIEFITTERHTEMTPSDVNLYLLTDHDGYRLCWDVVQEYEAVGHNVAVMHK